MAGEVRQREWIWEYFLTNCQNPGMLQELMISLPFPDENLHLKKMLLLRFLTINCSAGVIDDRTLDILRALAELNEFGGERIVARDKEDLESLPKKRKVIVEDETDEEVTLSAEDKECTPVCQRKRRVLPWDAARFEKSESCKGSNDHCRKSANAADIVETWLTERPTARDHGRKNANVADIVENWSTERLTARGDTTEIAKLTVNLNEKNELNASTEDLEQTKRDGINARNAGTSSGGSTFNNRRISAWRGYMFGPGQCPREWEVRLLVMVELAVKHLRAEPPNRTIFNHVVMKYWGDSMECKEWPLVEMIRERDQIKSELQMVQRSFESCDDLLQKYTKDRVEYVLKRYVDKNWEENGAPFLERVSADVLSGKYNPVNCNGKKTPKAHTPSTMGSAEREDTEEPTRKTPFVRASRGQFSRSREKALKRFAILDLDQDADDEVMIKPTDLDGLATREEDYDPLDLAGNVCMDTNGVEGRVSDPAENGPGIDPMSHREGVSINVPEIFQLVEEQCDRAEKVLDSDVEKTEVGPSECLPASSSPNPSDLNPNPASFSPPPWVGRSSFANVTEEYAPALTRKRKSGVIFSTEAVRQEQSNTDTDIFDAPAAGNCNNGSPDTTTIQLNLQKKQAALEGAVNDPLPKILMTTRVRSSLLEKNATARTSQQWEEEDDIEESPPSSPSASRCVRLPRPVTGHRISPISRAKRNDISDGKAGRRKHRKWTENEVNLLKNEVRKFGKGRWKLILESNLENFQGRTEVDLKDKWRNLERFEGIAE